MFHISLRYTHVYIKFVTTFHVIKNCLNRHDISLTLFFTIDRTMVHFLGIKNQSWEVTRLLISISSFFNNGKILYFLICINNYAVND